MSTLWPRTPVNNIQCEIWRRVGASDYNLLHPNCRTLSILKLLDGLVDNSLLGLRFSVLDLFCGDAVILAHIARTFPGASCHGVDVREYDEHQEAGLAGVVLHYLSVQEIITADCPERYDVVILLNTFRAWDRADLPPEDADLPDRVLAWLRHNARYIVVTATEAHAAALKAAGWWLFDIGTGEDDSRMWCMFWSGAK